MRVDVARDLSNSARDFIRVVWPAIRDKCGGGDVEPVESVTATGFARLLDMHSGIDAWHITSDGGIRGIASRIQWGDRDWRSFTIRKSRPSGVKTEWQKRTNNEHNRGFISPFLVSQAYINGRKDGDLIAAYMCRADDLYRFAAPRYQARDQAEWTDKDKAHAVWVERVNSDMTTFAAFNIDKMLALGARVFDSNA